VHDVWREAIGTSATLSLFDVRFAAAPPEGLPMLARHDGAGGELIVPPTGVAAALGAPGAGGATPGWLVLMPRSGSESLPVEREALWAFVDTVRAAM
jgi:hypothetical protein